LFEGKDLGSKKKREKIRDYYEWDTGFGNYTGGLPSGNVFLRSRDSVRKVSYI